jgi:hypothetical protein
MPLPALGQVTPLAERQTRELYWRCMVSLARRGKVPNVALSHRAYRVLQFLLGQRPGYFAHHQVIADAIESNLTSVRLALSELREAGFVCWELIPPPTGKYTRTNVNQYFVEADALLRALGGDEAAGSPRTLASTHPNSSASTGTDPKCEQGPPLTPQRPPGAAARQALGQGGDSIFKIPRRETRTGATERCGGCSSCRSGPLANGATRAGKDPSDVAHIGPQRT